MTLKKLIGICAAVAMIAMPTLAAAAPANSTQALSLAPTTRVGTTATSKSDFSREGAIIGGILILGIVVGGIIAIAKNDDSPNSP